jgi:hypothetical protein
MIIWNFKGIDTTFRSTPAKHDRDIFKMAKACGVPPETEIIYQHGNPNRPSIAHTFAVNDDTSNPTQQTVHEVSGPTQTRRKSTTGVLDLPGDVDQSTSSSDLLSDTADSSDHSIGSDSVAEQ